MNPEELAIVVSPEDVQAEVERILTSATLSRSTQLCSLLRFLVESSLRKSGSPKEHEIATVVFAKSVDFDPATDSIVRVQTSRLRAKLRQYYQDEASHSAIEIQISRGEYAIQVTRRLVTAELHSDPAPVDREVVAPAPTLAMAANKPSRRALFLYAGGASLVTAGFTAKALLPSTPAKVTLQQLTPTGTLAGPSKFSPDGKAIYFGSQGPGEPAPTLKSLPAFDDPAQRNLTDLGYPGARLYSVSEAGMLLLETNREDGLLWAPTPGRPAERIGTGIHAARWGAKGKMLVRYRNGESLLEYPEGQVIAKASNAFGLPFQNAIPSKQGNWIAFGRASSNQTLDYDLLATNVQDGSVMVLAKNWTFLGPPCWHPAREEVIVGGQLRGRQPGIFAIGLDGGIRPLWIGTQIMSLDDVRADGSMLLREYVMRTEVYGGVGGAKEFRQMPIGVLGYTLVAISPQGDVFALAAPMVAEDPRGVIHLWHAKQPDAKPVALTEGHTAVFAPDGKSLLVVRGYKSEPSQVVLIDLKTGRERDLTRPGYRHSHPRFASDGRSFFFLDRAKEARGESPFFQEHIDSGEVSPMGVSGRFTPVEIGSTGQVAFIRNENLEVWDRRTRQSRVLLPVGRFAHVVSATDTALILSDTLEFPITGQQLLVFQVDVATGAKREIRRMEAPPGGRFLAPTYCASRNGDVYATNLSLNTSKLYLMTGVPIQ